MALVDVPAPMVASVFEINCSVGDTVAAGDEVIVLESMKMEIPVAVEVSGTIAEILVQESDSVDEGDILLRIQTE